MHENGVNIRYLGYLASNTRFYYLKQFFECEIIARSFKKILNSHLANEILAFHKKQNKNIVRLDRSPADSNIKSPLLKNTGDASKQTSPISQGTPNRNQLNENLINSPIITTNGVTEMEFNSRVFDASQGFAGLCGDHLNRGLEEFLYNSRQNSSERLAELTVDFLNLLLGAGSETEIFWREILSKQAMVDYNHAVSRQNIVLSSLAFAVQFHCGISFNFDAKTQFGKDSLPFSKTDFKGFEIKTKNIQMKSLDLFKICEG
jgi:hypothetical protein